MFANVCTACRKREIVFSDQVRSLRPTDHGFAVRYLCSCGEMVTWHVEREGVTAARDAA